MPMWLLSEIVSYIKYLVKYINKVERYSLLYIFLDNMGIDFLRLMCFLLLYYFILLCMSLNTTII